MPVGRFGGEERPARAAREQRRVGAEEGGGGLRDDDARAFVGTPSAHASDLDSERWLEEIDRLADPLNMAAMHVQERPRTFHLLPAKRPGPFPGAPFAEVRAYAYRFADFELDPARSEACEEAALAKDGTLCPSVVVPGRVLSAEQVARLLEATHEPDPAMQNILSTCAFDPHHAFVFYDANGAPPMAELRVCLTCREWEARPATP